MTQVRCATCGFENRGLCTMKEVGVKANKPRECSYYKEDASRFKTTVRPEVVKFGYVEQELARKQRKAERKLERENLKATPDNGTARALGLLEDTNIKYPLTGDLSRFKTSVSGEE